MALFENFPYTDLHNLNLDWIIKIAKDFLDQYTHIQQLISDGETSLENLTSEGIEALTNKAEELETLLNEWYTTHSDDIAEQLTEALATMDARLPVLIASFNTAADQKAAQTIASIPDDYTALTNLVNEIHDETLRKPYAYLTTQLGIHADGTWAAGGTNVIIPVRSGEKLEIVARSAGVHSYYAFASALHYGAGNSIDFVSPQTALTEITDDNFKITVPAGAVFLLLTAVSGSDNLTPSNVYINGISTYQTIFESILSNCLYVQNKQIQTQAQALGYTDLKNLDRGSIITYGGSGTQYITSNDVPFSEGFTIMTIPSLIATYVGTSQIAISLLNGNMATRTQIGSWTPWYYLNNEYFVGATRNPDCHTFKTLKDCTEYIRTNNIVNATVYCDRQFYNLINEFGSTYLDTHSFTRYDGGLFVGNNTHYIFEQGSTVSFLYTGSNSTVKQYFSPFNIYGKCTIENASIQVENCRYCVHEDVLFTTQNPPTENKVLYKNCIMKHRGNNETFLDSFPCAIGGSCSPNSYTEINGGYYYSSDARGAIGYHNFNTQNYGNYRSMVVIRDVAISNKIYLSDNADSDADVLISGCLIPNGYSTGTTHMAVMAWNNSAS